jgi:hypothetical protein
MADVSFLDIADVDVFMTIRGVKFRVPGLTYNDIAALKMRFPEVTKILSGNTDGLDFMTFGPKLMDAVCAAGVGMAGDANAEEVASKLTLDEKTELLALIQAVTIPRGPGPFVENLLALGLAPVIKALLPDMKGGEPKTSGPSRKSSTNSQDSATRRAKRLNTLREKRSHT